jgi:hypothetical protein
MIYGYARVSTDGQSVAAQIKQLEDAGAHCWGESHSRIAAESLGLAAPDRRRMTSIGAFSHGAADIKKVNEGDLSSLAPRCPAPAGPER